MKVLFVAVFTSTSTNVSQAEAFERLGHEVIRYDYRERVRALGAGARDAELIGVIGEEKPDLMVLSKCNKMSASSIVEAKRQGIRCVLWFMERGPVAARGKFSAGRV
jgi:hypothetical protein